MEHNKKVIPFNSGDHYWTFLSFVTEAGADVSLDWDGEKTFDAEIAFEALVKNERKIKNHTE